MDCNMLLTKASNLQHAYLYETTKITSENSSCIKKRLQTNLWPSLHLFKEPARIAIRLAL